MADDNVVPVAAATPAAATTPPAKEPAASGDASGASPAPKPDATPAAGADPAKAGDPVPKPGDKPIGLGGGKDTDAATPADWPADWRTKGMEAAGIAADDKKTLAMLERLASPGDLVKKVIEQEKLIASGKHKAGLPKDATPEQIAQYRKDNGIPESADKYDLTLSDGLVIGEEDKPILEPIMGVMHKHNMSNEVAKDVISEFKRQEALVLKQRDDDIRAAHTKNDDRLHAEWGNDYRVNVNSVINLQNTFSPETRAALAGALDSDGNLLLSNAAYLKDMANISRSLNPIDTVVSGGGSNQMNSVDDEIKAIEKRMGGADPTYYKDEKAQERYRQLVDWKQRNTKK